MGCGCSTNTVSSSDQAQLNGNNGIDKLVRIVNVSDPSVNGLIGTTIRWLDNTETDTDDGGRFVVALVESGRNVALKPSSLVVIGNAPPIVEARPAYKPVPAHTVAVPNIRVKDEVKLHGLQNQNLNGSTGIVVNWIDNSRTSHNDGGRWNVCLKDGQVVAIKPHNLKLLGKANSRVCPLLSDESAEPTRSGYSPTKGQTDTPLGDQFNTKGKSNSDRGPVVATAVG